MKWTLVTGASTRLGKEIAIQAAKSGYNIVIHYNESHQEAEKVKNFCISLGVKAGIIQGDFSTCDGINDFINRYFAKFQATEHLVNTIGSYHVASLLKTEQNVWYKLFQSNFFSAVFLSQAFAYELKKSGGAIVNIGVAGINCHRADIYSGAYSIAKSALLSYTRSLAKELASNLVSVNMVSPGYIENSVDIPDDIKRLPMKRPAKAHEVASSVLYFLDRKNRYLTGQNLEVAGAVRL